MRCRVGVGLDMMPQKYSDVNSKNTAIFGEFEIESCQARLPCAVYVNAHL
jgi:hypothetical protein